MLQYNIQKELGLEPLTLVLTDNRSVDVLRLKLETITTTLRVQASVEVRVQRRGD